MKERIEIVISLIYFGLFVPYALAVALILFPIWLVSLWLDPRQRLVHIMSNKALFAYMHINPFWSYNFSGLENLVGHHAAILVSNHQSMADIVVLSGLPYQFKWVAKEYVFRLPIINWIMHMNGDIKLPDDSLCGVGKMMVQCRYWLRRGISLCLFPEGTRSHDGQLLPFKMGPFTLAAETNVPVIPVVVVGTREIWPKYQKHLHWREQIDICVLPAAYPADFDMNAERLRNTVRDLMGLALNRLWIKRRGRVAAGQPIRVGWNSHFSWHGWLRPRHR